MNPDWTLPLPRLACWLLLLMGEAALSEYQGIL